MIKLSKHLRPEAVAAKEGSRYAINTAWYDAETRTVNATDGRVAVQIAVDADPGEETGILPADALKAFRKVAKGVDMLEIDQSNGEVRCLGQTHARDRADDHRFPKVADVMPKREKAWTRKDGVAPLYTVIGVNVKMLAALGKAMGTDTVRLQITDENSPIRVDVIDLGDRKATGEAWGAIMPISAE